MNEIRISLDAEDFKILISGGIVRDDTQKVRICLKDIGYHVMYDLLYKEMAGKGYVMVEPTEHEKEFSENTRTHESVECERTGCKNMVLRKFKATYPSYCGNCYSILDGKEIIKQRKLEKKLTN